MVIDFGDLKEIMMDVIDKQYDHSFVFYIDDKYKDIFAKLAADGQKMTVCDFIPTAENLAKHWFNQLIEPLKERKIQLNHVKVWETPTSMALYTIKNLIEDNEN